MIRVLFTARAVADLADIEAYIAADNPSRALTFVDALRASCKALAHAPEAFPVIARYSGVELRRKRYGNYLIFYRISAAAIVITRVLHGARDYRRLLSLPRDHR